MTPVSAISVQDVGYTIAGHQVLSGISLDVPKGSIAAVMGMSGSGKTTLLKCLAGLTRPTTGRIMIDDADIATMTERELDQVRLKIGFVFQYAALFDSMCVYDNVAFGVTQHRRLPRREVDELVRRRLAEVHMAGSERLFPAELSGGMAKRVGLARALATEPSVLLYDEPTSGLDPVIGRTIDDLIVETRDRLGVTSVIVSHDIASIFRIADRVAMIHEGTLIAEGTPNELRASPDSRVRAFVCGSDEAGQDLACVLAPDGEPS